MKLRRIHVVAGVIIALGGVTLYLWRTSVPNDFTFLAGQRVTDSGLTYVWDTRQLYEYRAYNWRQAYSLSQSKFDSELRKKGFAVQARGPRGTTWRLNDIYVDLMPYRNRPGERSIPHGNQDYDPNWSLVMVIRTIDDTWLSELRLSMFERRE
jgi:hypothetical protein